MDRKVFWAVLAALFAFVGIILFAQTVVDIGHGLSRMSTQRTEAAAKEATMKRAQAVVDECGPFNMSDAYAACAAAVHERLDRPVKELLKQQERIPE